MYLSTTVCRLMWGPRRQDLATCTTLVVQTFGTLKALGYNSFFEQRRLGTRALREIDISPTSIGALLTKGINRTDIGRKTIPELGFSLSAWSGGKELESYVFSVQCGCYSKHVQNTLLLTLPPHGPYSFGQSEGLARKAFSALVKIWHPDTAHLCESNAGFANERFPSPEAKLYDVYEASAA